MISLPPSPRCPSRPACGPPGLALPSPWLCSWARRLAGGLAVVGAVAALEGCEERSQFLIVIDGDFALPETLDRTPELPPDAVIDTLRIDLLDRASGELKTVREVTLTRHDQMPLSFGICASGDDCTLDQTSVRLRVRAFRAALADEESFAGRSVLRPPAGVAIDRLLDVASPASGDRRVVRVSLTMACLGVATSFAKPESTCLDEATLHGPPIEGVSIADDELNDKAVAPAETRVGSWPGVRTRPCTAPLAEGRVCVAGGFAILGEPAAAIISKGDDMFAPAWPGRPVRLSPFWLDRTEVTVGEYRRLMQKHPLLRPPVAPEVTDRPGSNRYYCTWRESSEGESGDDLPVNCLDYAQMNALCEAKGGALPSEAQWEYAARGRGAGRPYPWGQAAPECCLASAGRWWYNRQNSCLVSGPERVGSHPASSACGGFGDVSLDGLLDLGGSLLEAVLGVSLPYDHPCWGEGPTLDPVCLSAKEGIGRVVRGGSWSRGTALTYSALRSSPADRSSSEGVRCAYRDSP
jgi:formylglycine-generating enzyme required for sulfatase activity